MDSANNSAMETREAANGIVDRRRALSPGSEETPRKRLKNEEEGGEAAKKEANAMQRKKPSVTGPRTVPWETPLIVLHIT